MRLNVHMPETAPRPRCQTGCGPATRIVEWRIDDPHSADHDEHYGPFYLLSCDDCVADALAQADDEGGVHIQDRPADSAELAALMAEAF